jgi:type I restriction enzyme S subunit
MTVKNKKPEIRFKGFGEEWKERNWKDSVDISTNMVDPKTGEYDKLPHIGPGNIESFTGRLLDNVLKVSESNLISGKFLYNKGEIIYGKINPQLAKYIIAPSEGLASADSYILNSKNGVEQKFLYTVLQTNDFYKYSVSVSARTGMPKINRDELNVYNYTTPEFEEQAKIGTFFQNLDSLITLHQRKYDKLTTVKKAMLEKMFPKDGADVPEIRFEGFTGKWENKTFGALMEIASASRVHKNEWTKSGVPFFRSSDIVSAYKGLNNDKAFISFELFKELAKKSGYVQEGDLLVTGGGSIGVPYLVRNNEPLYFKDADLLWFKKSESINSDFLYMFLTSPVFTKYINSVTHIGTISHYTIEQAKSTPFKLPKKDEQAKIGTFFQNLDSLISLQKRELEKLKNIKKSFLERMFV